MGDNSTYTLSALFQDDGHVFGEVCSAFGGGGVRSPDDIFSILEAFENVSSSAHNHFPPLDEPTATTNTLNKGATLVSQRSTSSSALQESEGSPIRPTPTTTTKTKKRKLSTSGGTASVSSEEPNAANHEDGLHRISHITVERNRRKQMNDHLTVLRSFMPSFYVKRGDQASIIGGVVEYINELQQILQSLEAKKQRKVYSEVLSPRLQVPSPRVAAAAAAAALPLSPRRPPPSPRLSCSLPISPRTPQPPSSPYHKPPASLLQQSYTNSPSLPSPTTSTGTSSAIDAANELVATSKSALAEVDVKFCGANVLLKTMSPRIPGQVMKIVSALEDLFLEILHVNVSTADDTMFNSITIKIGIECQLSADELAQRIQQTFS